jgi:hypothetical protein
VSFEQILKDEAESAKKRRNKYSRYDNVDWNSKSFIKRSFEDIAEKTLKITDKCHYMTDMKNVPARGDGKVNAKKKRMRKFLETEQQNQ